MAKTLSRGVKMAFRLDPYGIQIAYGRSGQFVCRVSLSGYGEEWLEYDLRLIDSRFTWAWTNLSIHDSYGVERILRFMKSAAISQVYVRCGSIGAPQTSSLPWQYRKST